MALVMIGLSIGTDSLIAFKSAFLTCLGVYVMVVMNMFYSDSRPFWDTVKITSYGLCNFSYASPGTEMFILTFFYTYNLIMYRFKYSNAKNSTGYIMLSWFLVLILIVASGALYFSGVALGMNYLY